MTTESNPSPRIDWGTIAPIAATVLTALGLWLTFTASLDHRFEVQQEQLQRQQDRMDRGVAELRQLIQSSESGRQADARSLNARVDAADARVDATEQLIVASSPLLYRCPPIG